ncbi:hydrolase [Legionella taurinensis]|uniref:Hydrolase n=1 Tax=Legionella taurinensis TaxID=70611 RepID=A0AB38N7R6_9GAMM|nr:hydrolase [Legionella taurinensis]MDX1836398.1 hydrolase [Legionella taurinensis]PUT43129.1 hydrolase [Legionella taurinensis]PUT45054.1 hydrolase [Legionella taurinensis]PUT45684.1 hydrolase [Legionella taurinensis]PUT49453.1 hydrolase [Legionella taurinensis]
MIIESKFKPAWWLTNGHGQTLYPTMMRRITAPVDGSERIELPDGDFIDLAWAVNGLADDTPLVILLHGLGGSIESTYVGGLMRAFNRHGWRAMLMHFRGASKEPNRLPRAYHSGDTGDLDYLLRLLAEREPNTLKAVVGVSLGGNVLLKWLGEQGGQQLVTTAVAVSVPFQLRLVADKMGQGFSRIYQSYLLRRLKGVFHRKIEFLNLDLPKELMNVNQWRCFWTFDEKVTAPLHGFAHVHAYYRQASCHAYLSNIATPTLIIHALDDPFMTPDVVPEEKDLSDQITLELSERGGHVGFISGSFIGQPVYWLEERIPAHLHQQFSKIGTDGSVE